MKIIINRGLGAILMAMPFFLLSMMVQVANADTSRQVTMPDFTILVKEVGNAVVNISTEQKRKSSIEIPHDWDFHGLPDKDKLEEFLRKFMKPNDDPDQGNNIKDSLGSGFIVSADGYVLTNHHVVKDAAKILVRLSDRREFVAELVGSDKRSDIALLKIKANNLPVVRIGNSTDLKVGEWVVAIGSPFGFDQSVTVGVVSFKGRSLPEENYVPFIQTDVAINPGNSGGPLFNLDGEVVGINSQIFSRTGGYMGLSFAIPIDIAMNVVDQLKSKGSVSRGWLGVYIQELSTELAESFGMDRPKGALVTYVIPESPAQKAGIEVGDVIIEYNGHPIQRSSELPPRVGETRIGDKVPVLVVREGKTREIKLTIGELPEQVATPGEITRPENGSLNKVLNIRVKKLASGKKKDEARGQHGLEVTEVDSGAGDRAGLEVGDILLMLNNIELKDVRDLDSAVASIPKGKTVPMLVFRGEGPRFLVLKLED